MTIDEKLNEVKGDQIEPLCLPSRRDEIALQMATTINEYVPRKHPIHSEQLVNNGYVKLDNVLSTEQIQEIKDFLSTKNCYNSHVPFGDGSLRRIERNAQCWCYDLKDLLACPHILDTALNENILDIVDSYLGCTPTLYSVNTFWSLTGFPARGIQEFHRDIDDFKFLCLFIYLTNVKDNCGPHCFIEGTHTLAALTKVLNDETLALSMFPPQTMTGHGRDGFYNQHLGNQERVLTGEPGTTILLDTFGLHKGVPHLAEDRLVIWLRYGLHKAPPSTVQTPHPHSRSLIHKDCNVKFDDRLNYITRVILDP